jgi:hypothetical protein
MSADKPAVSALFIGNSLTFVNDVPTRWQAALSEQFTPTSQMVAIGGYRLDQHAQDAMVPGTDLARLLGVEAPAELRYDYVVLQEQSWAAGDTSDADATAGTLALARLAQEHGARVILYETWGYNSADSGVGFVGMQYSIDNRFQDLAAYLTEQGVDVALAPAGFAFQLIYDEVLAEGGNPESPGSEFSLLYDDDRHPSVRGAYLAACVLAGASADDVVADFPDEPSLGADVSRHLRDVCERALRARRVHVPTRLRPAATIFTEGTLQGCGGRSLAVSADGNRIAVAFDTSATASIYRTTVFRRDASGWTPEASFASGPVIEMNEAGDVLVAGPPTRVWRRTAETWIEDSAYPNSPYWSSWADLALTGDGHALFVAGMDGVDQKFVQFTWQDAAWVENILFDRAIAMVATDRVGNSALLGSNLLFAEEQVFSPSGFAVRNSQQTQVPASSWYFTQSVHPMATRVALSRDGAVSAWLNRSYDAAVSVMNVEQPMGQLFQLGDALELGENGETIVVGDSMGIPVEAGGLTGAVHVFRQHQSQYQYDFELLAPPYNGPPRGFSDSLCVGAAVGMSADKSRVFVHAPNARVDGQVIGAVYEFVLPPLDESP